MVQWTGRPRGLPTNPTFHGCRGEPEPRMASILLRHLNRFVALTALCLISLPSAAATRHAPADYPTIQAAIDAAVTGDEVLVEPGTYLENLDTHLKHINLKSTGGPDVTIVDGRSLGRALIIGGGGLVEGFTFQHGYDVLTGGGIYCPPIVSGDTTAIRSNVIRNNSAAGGKVGEGGGLAVLGAFIFVENNQITDNYAGGEGGGIVTYGGLVFVRNNVLRNNHADLGGGAASVHASKFSGNLVDANFGLAFGGGVLAHGGTIEHCTIVNNRSGRGAGIYFVESGIGRHNIVARNIGPGIDWNCDISTLECNDLWANGTPISPCVPDTVGGRNFSADPLFCDPAGADYRISAASPCAAAGPSGCVLIGAFDIGCGAVPARREAWGTIKVRYR